MSSLIESLPFEIVLHISSYILPKELGSFSKTSKANRKKCGILKLNQVYEVALKQFRSLQDDFTIQSRYHDVENKQKNIYVVDLKNAFPSNELIPSLEFNRLCFGVVA